MATILALLSPNALFEKIFHTSPDQHFYEQNAIIVSFA